MSENNKIRLILIGNPLTSLFMSTWFRQKKYIDKSDTRTILVSAQLNVDDTYSENSTLKMRINEECYRAPWNDLDLPWLNIQPDPGFYPGPVMPHPLREYKKRKAASDTVNAWLSENAIPPDEVCEIWHSNELADIFLLHVCKNARDISFEHGLSDVFFELSSIVPAPIGKPMWKYLEKEHLRQIYLSNHKPLMRQIKDFVKNIYSGIMSTLLKGSVLSIPNQSRERIHISILADEIQAAGSATTQYTIDPDELRALTERIARQEPSIARLMSLQGNTAVILVSQIKLFAESDNDHREYFQAFERYILRDWAELFEMHNIKNLVFKTQLYHEDYFREVFDTYSELKKKYNIYLIAEYPDKNLNVEYYLPALKPKLLIGAYSSGLLFAKKIYPYIKTISYHEWFIDYTMKRYHNTYNEFLTWLPKAFEVNYGYIFRPILPDKAPYKATSEEI